MALFDKLKGLADKAKETAKDVADITKGVASSVAKDLEKMGNSPEAQAAREEARKAERARYEAEMIAKEQAKKDLFNYLVDNHADYSDDYRTKYKSYLESATEEEALELQFAIEKREQQDGIMLVKKHIENLQCDCDLGKGDCCWLGEHFYCTCSADTECPRKKYIKAKQCDTLFSNAHLPYAKVLGSFKLEQNIWGDGEWCYRNLDVDFEASDVIRAFFAEFLPEYGQDLLGDKIVLAYFYENGLGQKNSALDILFDYKEKTGGKALPWFPTILELEEIDLRQEFFKNPSLYDRNRKDFMYTVRILNIVNNPDKLSAYFEDTSNISIEQLYNPDGTIKDAGIGGAKEGFYGDVIFNIVESWGGEEE